MSGIAINLDKLKKQTEDHYKSEGKDQYFAERVEKFKEDIVSEFSAFQSQNPEKQFSDYRDSALASVFGSITNINETFLPIGLFLIALDEIVSENLL
ncbi:hypothetical protein [Chryseobacterium caseinilyticum]|uniref:Uncharacterized protein n=1 Tax=Chryseobacterium caseinilyticum TaxID=2771428 RepID=A0ABR8Z858_9FLAO|nr:hypothetical protein [Chryseobacterium caseinilyticum]MBD8081100.1 hypothetical protein [Chryseobacterium caseinilyticum]